MISEITVSRAGIESVDDLRPVYLSIHDYYQRIAPTIAGHPTRCPQDSWRLRRARYVGWLAEAGAFVARADLGDSVIGYAIVSLGVGSQAWQTAEEVADLHDIAVLADYRNVGVGTRLLDCVEHELTEAGVSELRLNVIAANVDARRLYERRGMTITAHTLLGRVRG